MNPFLDQSFAIRWSELKPELIQPAIEEALGRAQAAVDAIAAIDQATANFANTFLALEEATQELNLAWGKVGHLQSVCDSPALREAHNAMLPKVSAFYAAIPLNPELWKRLKRVATDETLARSATLSPIQQRFLEETMLDFRQAGADLPLEKRARLEALQSELSQVTQKYGENVLDATNGWQTVVVDEARLAGLPPLAKAAARKSAEGKGLSTPERPAWRFTLHQPSLEPVMTYADDDSLRHDVWAAAAAVGSAAPFDNAEPVRRILGLRAEKASLLRKDHFADLVLERRMARSAKRALEFIEDLQRRAQAAFARECGEVEEYKRQALSAKRPAASAGEPDRLKAWEVGYWAEKLHRERYDFDEELLRPYFPMDRVISGLFELVKRVFGVKVEESGTGPALRPRSGQTSPSAVEVWHPEVKFYEMRNSRGRHIGSFYADWHPRESKRGGAWFGYLMTGAISGDRREPHLGYICGNLTAPVDGKPALLNHHEVQTVFHEFGHLLHHLLGEVEIKSLNGVNVAWDFVELPSQILENWCWERESLDLFARHYETGDPIPADMFDRMTAARNFRAACATMRQVQFAKMDLILHMRTAEFVEGDIEAKVRAVIADCMIPTQPPARTIIKRFNHIFSDPTGYAAGYYSYKWAEVLDADAFGRFKREGIFNPRTGADFVRNVLSRGNSADPMELYRGFMGRDPDIQALLVRSGLAA